MKSGVPWSIRGIDDDIRDAARAAARRSGLSVSEWLNDLIAKQAAAEGIAPTRSRHEDDDTDGDAEADAVADAVQRLTRRIRAMDDNSRAALSGLQDRLDEIEMRLETVAVSGGRGTERARSLKGVATIVDELSREIDNADENARSMIEGLRARGAAKAPHREIGIDRVAEAIRGLDERISSMSERIKSPAAEEPPAGLDTIKARLDSLLAGSPARSPARSPAQPSGRAAALDATLRSLETHIDQAKSRLAAATRRPSPISTPVSMTSDDEDRIRRIESHLAEITGGIAVRRGATRPTGRGGDFASAVAEISARQRSIDDRADYASLARDQRHVVDSLAALRADISALADGMVSLGRGDADDKDAYFGLARRIDTLAAERPVDRDDLSRMRADLEAVRATLDGGAGLARLDTVGEEIAAIRRALEADDSPRAIARLEMRVAELGRGMEAALNASKAASRRGDTDGVGRLEMRLDAIAARIDDFLGRAAPADAISGLQERFAKLADRLERVSVARQEPPAALDEIKSEIAAIRRDISGRAVPKVDHLEEQIADLASRLDSATRSESEGQALAELEAQVAHMASELERSMPRTATLKQVEENLARLQGFLSDNRQESVDAARAAARDAVREIAGSPGDSDLVRALKGDLENIRAAAGDADQRTQETLGSVHETLARVVDRLTRLEHETGETGAEMAREPAKATGTYGAEAPIPRAESGLAGSRAGLARLPEDNRPLEPGSGKPDLAALRELARSASEAQRDKKGDRKADFIAAARRAAQAAATEAASDVVEEEEGDDGKPGAFARIGQAIRKRRRPLLLAAAALVLAISALHLFGERGIKSVELSPDTAAIDRTVGGIPAGPLASDTFAVEAPTTPTVPQVSKSALVAPPPDGRSAIAFAEPEGFDSRFGDVPATPPASGFSPPPAPAPAGATMAALDAPPSRPPETSAMSETASATGSAIGPQKLREAAAAGDPAAAFEVAARYAEGNGVQPDLAKAAEWYRRAAEAGIAVAQYRLGSLYERGQGVARDLATAVTWYQRAADQGNVGAMHNLAVMMSEGVDGAPDHAKAFDWFLAAANCGVKDSQYNLGVIYARGLGPGQNLVESYKWFAVAAAGGDTDATLRRDEVAKVLSPDDLAKARAAVQAWRAKPVISEANTVATPAGGWQGPSSGVTEADRRALVKKIQTLLAEQGYDPGPLDGFEGPKTQEAVKAFQRKIGESETGQISGDLVAALASPPT